MQREDYSHHVKKHVSPAVRMAFVVLGCLCVALGILGAFLPLLPTTPFMLLAAGCFARASTRFYNWLLNTKAFGPSILEWRLHRSIPYRIKLVSIATMAITLGISIAVAIEERWLQVLVGVFGLFLAAWMYRIPSRDCPKRKPSDEQSDP
jgi:uncharacterized membrane protein YbaN (DUF454 family)